MAKTTLKIPHRFQLASRSGTPGPTMPSHPTNDGAEKVDRAGRRRSVTLSVGVIRHTGDTTFGQKSRRTVGLAKEKTSGRSSHIVWQRKKGMAGYLQRARWISCCVCSILTTGHSIGLQQALEPRPTNAAFRSRPTSDGPAKAGSSGGRSKVKQGGKRPAYEVGGEVSQPRPRRER